jgi:glycosyltransferase involved in cell wall biosynthesis
MNSVPVTALIPTYNCGSLVVQAVESVLAQTTVPSQIIVVDDGSTDGTCERLTSYRDRIQYIHQSNRGVSTARNRGIAEARHDVIAFLDADDVWHPRKVEAQLAALAQHPDIGLMGTKGFDWPIARFPSLPDPIVFSLERVGWQQLAVKSRFVTSTIMLRREVLTRVGDFDPELRRAEDRDLYVRVAKAFPVANLNLPLTGFRPGAGSLSRQVATMRQGGERLLHKLKEDRQQPLSWVLSRQASSYLDYTCANTCEAAGYRIRALGYLLKSMAAYPLPFDAGVRGDSFERMKRFGVVLMRLLLRRPTELQICQGDDEDFIDALAARKGQTSPAS